MELYHARMYCDKLSDKNKSKMLNKVSIKFIQLY